MGIIKALFQLEDEERNHVHNHSDKGFCFKCDVIGALRKSPIQYFSDLFIVAMVLTWIVTIIAMIIMGTFSTIAHADNSIWTDVGTLVAVPLSAGGAIWMVKNSVQHAIMNKRGEIAPADFAEVNVENPAKPDLELEKEIRLPMQPLDIYYSVEDEQDTLDGLEE